MGVGGGPDLSFPAPAEPRGPSNPLAPTWPREGTPGLVDHWWHWRLDLSRVAVRAS